MKKEYFVLAVVFLFSLFLIPSVSADAAIQTIQATGEYTLGDEDTLAQAKDGAKKNALRSAAEQAGVFIRSYSKTNNAAITDDQVEVISAQVLQIKSCTYDKKLIGNHLTYIANLTVAIDDENIKKSLDIFAQQEQKKQEQQASYEQQNKVANLCYATLSKKGINAIDDIAPLLKQYKPYSPNALSKDVNFLIALCYLGEPNQKKAIKYIDAAITADMYNEKNYILKAMILENLAYDETLNINRRDIAYDALKTLNIPETLGISTWKTYLEASIISLGYADVVPVPPDAANQKVTDEKRVKWFERSKKYLTYAIQKSPNNKLVQHWNKVILTAPARKDSIYSLYSIKEDCSYVAFAECNLIDILVGANQPIGLENFF